MILIRPMKVLFRELRSRVHKIVVTTWDQIQYQALSMVVMKCSADHKSVQPYCTTIVLRIF